MEATDMRRGISLTDRLRAVVSVLKEQNSVSRRKLASVSECK